LARYFDPLSGKFSDLIDLGVVNNTFDLSPDAKTLLVMTAGEHPRLIDVATGKLKFTLEGHKRRATAGAFSPDGKLIVTVTGTRPVSMPPRLGKVPAGPAEYAVWDAATGKLLRHVELTNTDLNFSAVRFSPDSKFFVATNRQGQGEAGRPPEYYAFGVVPFPREGGAALNVGENKVQQPKLAPAVGPQSGVVSDSMERLIDELAKSNKSGAEKIDALFLAALGRFATANEQKRVKEKFGDKPTEEQLRTLLTEIAGTPEFESHLKSLLQRQPAKPGQTLRYW